MSEHTSSAPGVVDILYLPHGTQLLDPTLEDLPAGAAELHAACSRIAEAAFHAQHDHVILLTPHGLGVDGALAVYSPGGSGAIGAARGDALWCGEWSRYRVDVQLDGALAGQLQRELHEQLKDVVPVVSIRAFGGLLTPLRWGEVVPLHFYLRHGVSTESKTIKNHTDGEANNIETKTTVKKHDVCSEDEGRHLSCTNQTLSIAIMSVPRRPYANSASDSDAERAESLSFRSTQLSRNAAIGQAIDLWAQKHGRRVLLLVSGDQSHVHPIPSEVCNDVKYRPDPSSHFPCDAEVASTFDACWNEWVHSVGQNQSHADRLVESALQLDDRALCCGLSGLLTIHGLVSGSKNPSQWRLVDHAYGVPTYFGMMASHWQRC